MKKLAILFTILLIIVAFTLPPPERPKPVPIATTALLEIPLLIFPVDGPYRISSRFGNREVIIPGVGGEEGDFHRGVDIVPKTKNAKVLAAGDGVVVLHYPPPSRYYKGHPVFGGMIVMQHSNGVVTVYGHMKNTFVTEGQYIRQGTAIGIVGSTGLSTGVHLHFEALPSISLLLKL